MIAQRLSDILRRDLPVDPEITGITADSRKVRGGTLFAALPGHQADGRTYISQASARGAPPPCSHPKTRLPRRRCATLVKSKAMCAALVRWPRAPSTDNSRKPASR